MVITTIVVWFSGVEDRGFVPLAVLVVVFNTCLCNNPVSIAGDYVMMSGAILNVRDRFGGQTGGPGGPGTARDSR